MESVTSMPTKVELLGELAELLNQRRPVPITRYFTEDFRLDDAGAGVMLTGHVGAKRMIDDILSLAPDVNYQILDTVEAADRVAVRWRVTGTRTTGSFDVTRMAIYRFADGPMTGAFGVPCRRAAFQGFSSAT